MHSRKTWKLGVKKEPHYVKDTSITKKRKEKIKCLKSKQGKGREKKKEGRRKTGEKGERGKRGKWERKEKEAHCSCRGTFENKITSTL